MTERSEVWRELPNGDEERWDIPVGGPYPEWFTAPDATYAVLGKCPHGVDLDREFCPQGCRV